jgi:hypothetical protein
LIAAARSLNHNKRPIITMKRKTPTEVTIIALNDEHHGEHFDVPISQYSLKFELFIEKGKIRKFVCFGVFCVKNLSNLEYIGIKYVH